jgi:hypothetical protein
VTSLAASLVTTSGPPYVVPVPWPQLSIVRGFAQMSIKSMAKRTHPTPPSVVLSLSPLYRINLAGTVVAREAGGGGNPAAREPGVVGFCFAGVSLAAAVGIRAEGASHSGKFPTLCSRGRAA